MTNMAPHKSQFGAVKDEQRFLGADLEPMLVSRRGNVEAMMQMSRLTLDGVQLAWRRQLDFFEQAVEGFTNLASSLGQRTVLPRSSSSRKAEYSRQAFEKNLASARELTELTAKAASDAMSVISQRFWDGLDEARRAR
jgi:hypothetical protein